MFYATGPVTGYANELKQIGAEAIRECATELDVSLGISGPVNRWGSKASNHSRVPEIIRSMLRALRSKEKALSARLSALGSRALQPKRLWRSLLEHSVALRKRFRGLAIRLRRIIGVGRAYGTVIDKIRLLVSNPAEGGVPHKHRRRSALWTTAALVGVLGFLLYSSFLTRSSVDISYEHSAAAVGESAGGRKLAEHGSPTNSQAPMPSEGLSAMKTRPSSDPKDSTQAALEPVSTALTKKGKINQPAVVTRNRNPWEEILFLTLGFFLLVLSKFMTSRFLRSVRTSSPLTQSLLEHSVALREHFEGLAIRLRRIIGVGRAYGTVINKIRLNVANPAEDGVPHKHRRRSALWTTAALVGVLGFLLYLSFLTRSSTSTDANSTTSETQDAFYKKPPEIVLSSLTSIPQVQKFYLLFKSGSAELEDESFKVLMHVSQLLSTHPNSRITLTLFFDPTAKSGYTSKLFALRVDGIKSFFAGQGAEADLRVVGRSGVNLPEIKKPPGPRGLESWSEIRIETGKEG